jgi:coatomer subunit beta
LPIVDDEMKKAAGEITEEDIQMTQGHVQKLVTADGTYASQSAFIQSAPSKKNRDRPIMRQYLMDGDFFIGAALSTSLMKLALRYISLTKDKKRENVCFTYFIPLPHVLTSIHLLGICGRSPADNGIHYPSW